MALDYSKLSDEELEAIANDDYSKLSDKTLQAISNDPGAKQAPAAEPTPNFTPQIARTAAGGAMPVAEAAGNVAATVGKAGVASAKDWANIGKILYEHGNLSQVGQFLKEPVTTGAKAVEAYVAGHPWAQNVVNTSPKEAISAIGSGAKNMAGSIGRGLVQGAVAPESLMLLPYQMAAYEQEKIQQDPNAPGLERNPYAMAYRGEAPSQGVAGAMNQRRAVMSMPITGVTAEERKILEEDQRRRLEMLTRYEAAKRVLGPKQ